MHYISTKQLRQLMYNTDFERISGKKDRVSFMKIGSN